MIGASRKAGAGPPAKVRFVAIHRDVIAEMKKWETEGNHGSAMGKMLGACDAFVKREDALYEALLRQNACEKLKNGSGVLELGPKQKKGGAPRLFILRRQDGLVLLSADVEKGSKGVRAMGIATQRAGQIPSNAAMDDPLKAAATLGPTYVVFTEPPIGNHL